MARQRFRNPRNRRKRRRNDGDGDGDDTTSDSDFVVDELNLDDGEDEVEVLETENPGPQSPHRPKRNGGRKRDGDPNLRWKKLEKENEKWVAEHELDLPVEEPPLAETADPSPAIILPLLRFQKEFLAWALKQERSEVLGGILADEMGMGKTIQAISLVLTSRDQKSNLGNLEASSSSLPRTGATLVICPVVAVIQWVGEIERYTEKGCARVLVYHGPKRAKSDYDFTNYDFVITTYQTIEYDYRRNIMPEGKECMYCGKKYSAKSMKIHLRYHCGPNARKTAAQAKQDKKKKKMDADEKGKGKKGDKPDKKKKVDDEGDEHGDGPRGVSLLHSIKWERIILDEAHFIKDRSSNTARAIFALDSLYKWALSGTPLQNRVGELYSLIRFLRVYPYANYFCKDCNCAIFDHTASDSGRTCLNCPHGITRHFCWWNRYINKPVQGGMRPGDGKRAMVLLKGKVLKSIVLRRTKKGRAADLALPPRIAILRRDSLDKNEKEFYEALYTQSRVQFDAYIGAGTLMNNYAHIFDLLTRLRQAVDHPYLVVYSKTGGLLKESEEGIGTDDCGICHDPVEDAVVTSCNHVFCKACLIEYSAALGNVSCPSCREPLTVDLTTNSGEKNSATAIKGCKRSGILNRLKIADFKTSTKIDALREEIRNMVERDGSAKGIVFSQFTSFLDLINFSLQMSGIKCVQLVGSMTLADREKAIKTFTEDGDCKIFLMSLKAGGVALNLTVASYVFLMDPWWNPAVERQAQDRIHRIGQYKPIRAVRFVIEDTIEERILKLQKKKELVFEGTVGDSKDAFSKLTEADLRFLFQI